MEKIIEIRNVTKKYGKNIGIDNVNLEINKGEVFGFIGPNGSGKSTTIKCIMDLINKNFGEISIDSKIVKRKNKEVKAKIGYLPAEINLYDDLTVKQMIEYSNSFYLKDCMPKAKELMKRLDVDEKKKIDELSLGNLKKVGIILCLMHEPEIIIMDEATSGLDPLMQEIFYEIIEEEKQKGKTIFFSSHILSEIKRICDNVAIIKNGKIIKVDKIENLSDSHFVKVNLESENVEEIKQQLSLNEFNQNKNKIEFVYEDINKLIEILSKYKIIKILISELDIEEIFINYYKN